MSISYGLQRVPINILYQKDQIIQCYLKHNIQSITLRRYDNNRKLGDVLTFNWTQFSKNLRIKNPTAGGPSKDDLYIYLYLYLKTKNTTALEPEVGQIAKKV